MVHGELIKAGQVQKLTYRQLHALEKMDGRKAREAKWIELLEHGIDAGSNVLGRALEGTITGPVVLTLILISAYGWAPTRTLIENLAQGAAYGAAQGWKNSVAPTLANIPGISPFFPTDNQQQPPGAPPASSPPTCIDQWTFLK